MPKLFPRLLLVSAALFLCAFLLMAWAIAPVHAQETITAPAGFVPKAASSYAGADGKSVTVSAGAPLPVADGPLAAASSTALTGTATTGTTPIGPFAPQLGRDIRVILRGTWAGTFAVGTSVDACATINPLTIGGTTWGSYTANANEVVDTPTLAGVVYCATATITSGTLSYGVRQ